MLSLTEAFTSPAPTDVRHGALLPATHIAACCAGQRRKHGRGLRQLGCAGVALGSGGVARRGGGISLRGERAHGTLALRQHSAQVPEINLQLIV